MRVDFKDLYEGPRFEKRVKTRRYNKIINIVIALLFIVGLFFTYNLIFGGSTEPVSTEIEGETSKSENGGSALAEDEQDGEKAPDDEDESQLERDGEIGAPEVVIVEESPEAENEIVENNSGDSNIKLTVVNKAWKPIGTFQSEPHVAVYEDESIDRKEMHSAIQYATALNEQEWILWRIGNDGSPHRAKGVVSTKDKKYVYRVFIEWVPNKGWMPTKVEHLIEVPIEYTTKTTDEEEASVE